MRSKDILNIHIDFERGEYVLSRYNGEQTLVKPMNTGETRSYDKAHIKSRREEIIGKTYVPKEREKQIDVGLYDALAEFDKSYGTNYAKKYFEITIEQIPYAGLSEKARDRKIRAHVSKMAMFVEARMNIDYDLNIFRMSKSLSLRDRFQAIRVALAQKVNGIQVNLNKSKKTENFLPEYIETESEEEREIAKILEDMRAEREKIKKATDELSSQIPDDEQQEDNEKIEEVFTQTTDNSQEEIITPEIIDSKANEQSESEQKAEAEAKPETKTTYEQKPKKTMSRSKSIQASKRAAREAGKLKNMYQNKIKDKTNQPVKTAEQIKKEAEQRRIAKAQKAAEAARKAREQEAEAKRLKAEQEKAEKERIAREEQAKEDAKLSSKVKRIILGKKGTEGQEEHIVKRFTRKLKDQRDSIRNKIHIPKISGTKRTIAGAVGVVCVVAVLGIGLTSLGHNANNSSIVDTRPAIESTYEMGAETEGETQDIVQATPEAIKQTIRFEENNKTPISTVEQESQESQETSTKEETSAEEKEENESSREESTEADSRVDYLSAVRVGATMNIESGKYFECPDGTGNYGHFENQTGKKEISIIGVATESGYFAITDSSISLYDLKQMYPDAKFSYHFICRYEDGSTKTLGWLTESSIEQNIENSVENNTQQQSAGEER